MTTRRILFIDRDGTMVREPEDYQVDALDKIRLVPGVIGAMLALKAEGYEFVMVSNQDGAGTASFPEKDFQLTHNFILDLFRSQGLDFIDILVCPHLETDGCSCRKPAVGLVMEWLKDTTWDRERSALVGDRNTDIKLAKNMGIQGLRVLTEESIPTDEEGPAQSWEDIAATLIKAPRKATISRHTKETKIEVTVNLDQPGQINIYTGLGFFDHMLEQLASHGGFALDLKCSGDLEIDEHHTVEDVAITLGKALRQALGNKVNIGRYGFLLPMDETLAQVAIDLSGRACYSFEGKYTRESVGELPTEMVDHFFKSLAESLGAALHIKVKGENCHHIVEGMFKSVARTLRQAFAKTGHSLPSTKGVL